MAESYPVTPEEYRELAQALWRCALVLRKYQTRDMRGKLMWPAFVRLSREAQTAGEQERREE